MVRGGEALRSTKISFSTVLVTIVVASSLSAFLVANENVTAFTPHAPIVIYGDGDFTAANGVTGGSGIPSDPYIIEGWEFDSSAGQGICLQGTTAHVVIRGNSVHETSWSGGIELWYSTNVDIENNTIYNNYQNGIFLYHVLDVFLRDNDISGNSGGLVIVASTNVTMEDNTLTSDSVFLYGDVNEMSSHSISTSNLVNGYPVYYFKDESGLVVDGVPAGELIAVNCSDVEVMNVECSMMFLAYVDNVHVHDNNVSGGDYGIYLKVASNTTVDENIVSSSESAGIDLDDSTTTSVVQNEISGSGWAGIYMEDSDALVSGNIVEYNGYQGISLHSAYSTNISGNQLVGNVRDGIEVWYCASIRIEGNSASLNGNAGAFVGYSSDISVMGNNFSSNMMYGVCMEEQVSDIAVINNNLSSNGECGISSVCWSEETTGNITLAENKIDWNGETGIYLEYTDDVSICSNQVTHNGAGISVNYCDFFEIADNSVLSNTLDGIQLTYSNESTLTDNDCSSNGHWGMEFYMSSNNTLVNNNCSSNDYDGIYLGSSSDFNTLVSNRGFWNTYNGIDVVLSRNNTLVCNIWSLNGYDGAYIGYSTNNTLDSNNCSANNRWGIQLLESNGNIIIRNQLCNNHQFGVNIGSGSSHNMVFNNTLIGNNGAGSTYDPSNAQACDDGSDNGWNNTEGYGNYWSDWTTPDIAPPYGIADIPYDISGSAGAKDYYPQTTPQAPIPEFGAMPFVVMILMSAILLTMGARRKTWLP